MEEKIARQKIKNPTQKCAGSKDWKMENEIDRKPGSVLNDDLSRPAIADRFVPPSGHASSAVRPI